MHRTHLHSWDVSAAEAREIQVQLSSRVVDYDRLGEIRRVGGVDIGFREGGRVTRAAVVVLSFPELELLDHRIVEQATRFPYLPGLLSFREVPAALEAMGRLESSPDLLLCDGQGKAHPRRFGLACHLGILTDLPSIGVAKSRLVGVSEALPLEKGAWVPLRDNDQTIGAVLRTRSGVRPVYVSVGHRVSLRTAIEFALHCCRRYRLPETTRWAHRLASGAQPTA